MPLLILTGRSQKFWLQLGADLTAMASCPKCRANVTEGMPFCTQCGASLEKPAAVRPTTPLPPKPVRGRPLPGLPGVDEESRRLPERVFERPPVKRDRLGSAPPPSKFEGLDLEIHPPRASKLEEADAPSRPSGAAAGLVCRFCKGPLNLELGFCEYCGAPVEEAAPPGWIKPKPPPPLETPSTSPATASPPTAGSTASPSPQAAPGEGPPASPRLREKLPPGPPAKPPDGAQVTRGGGPEPAPAGMSPATTLPVAAAPGALPLATGALRSKPVPAKPAAAATPPATPQVKTATAGPKPAAVPPLKALASKKRKGPPHVAIWMGTVVVLVAAGGASWYFLRPKPAPQTPSAPAVTTPAPAQAPALERVPATTATEVSAPGSPAVPRPKTPRIEKPAATPAPAPPPANPQQAQIISLENRAREAYAKGNYAEPADTSAIAFAKQVLEISPSDDYAKRLLEDAVHGGTYQVQQAIATKDFATARRISDVMGQLLAGRNDVAGLKEDIASAERAEAASHRPPPAAPLASFRVYHMHTEKPPADKGPHCQGTLSVVGQRLKFVAESVTDGQLHNFDSACADIREIKKNSRVAARQGGFHVRTAKTNYNFVPVDSSSSPAPALASACSK